MPLTKLSASGIARCADMMAPPPILASRERGRGRLPETIQARYASPRLLAGRLAERHFDIIYIWSNNTGGNMHAAIDQTIYRKLISYRDAP